jgi:hypothetical protein
VQRNVPRRGPRFSRYLARVLTNRPDTADIPVWFRPISTSYRGSALESFLRLLRGVNCVASPHVLDVCGTVPLHCDVYCVQRPPPPPPPGGSANARTARNGFALCFAIVGSASCAPAPHAFLHPLSFAVAVVAAFLEVVDIQQRPAHPPGGRLRLGQR